MIASGIGEPLHTEKSRLDPYSFGNTKIKVEIDLYGVLPAEVEVRDSAGFFVRVKAEYPNLPPKCCNCGRFGHYLNRCLMPPQKRHHSGKEHTLISSKISLVDSKIPLSEDIGSVNERVDEALVSGSSSPSRRRRKSRSRSRGRKKDLSKGVQAEKHWVPVEQQQLSPPIPSESTAHESESEGVILAPAEDAKSSHLPLSPGDTSQPAESANPETAGSEPLSDKEDADIKGEPWQIKQSKKKKRALLQEALWRSPAASSAKALRFRVRSQAAAVGRRL